MSKALEDYGKQVVLENSIQIALRMIARGKLTLEQIAEDTHLSLENVKELAEGKQLDIRKMVMDSYNDIQEEKGRDYKEVFKDLENRYKNK